MAAQVAAQQQGQGSGTAGTQQQGQAYFHGASQGQAFAEQQATASQCSHSFTATAGTAETGSIRRAAGDSFAVLALGFIATA